jgi:hypothetical protein
MKGDLLDTAGSKNMDHASSTYPVDIFNRCDRAQLANFSADMRHSVQVQVLSRISSAQRFKQSSYQVGTWVLNMRQNLMRPYVSLKTLG